MSGRTAETGAERRFAREDTVEILHPAIAINRSLAMGAAWGAVAWSAYALVEYLLCAIWPLFTIDQAVFTPLNWQLTAWLFWAYWLLGAAAGALLSFLSARLPRNGPARNSRIARSRLAGALSLYLAVLLSLLLGPALDRASGAVLGMDVSLLAATAWVLLRPASRLAPWLVPDPALAAFLILGPAWFSIEVIAGLGTLPRRLGAILLALLLVGLGRWLHRYPAWIASQHLAANLAVLGGVIAASAALSGFNRELPPPPRATMADPGTPPVLLVSLDTTRADHLSVYGYSRKTTPYLEEFARGATLYTEMVAASDMTLSSHGSIFTGLYPSWHGAHFYSSEPVVVHPLNPTVPTLAQLLAGRGVFTAGVAANNAFLAPEWGLARGFQSFDVRTPVQVLPTPHGFFLRRGIRKLLSCCFETMGFDAMFRRAGEVNNDVFGIMENGAVRARSFFLFVNYMDAHTPYVAPLAEGSPLPSGRGAPFLAQYNALLHGVLRDKTPVPAQIRDRLLERYDAGIAAEDAAFHELTGWLKRRGLYDSALIVVTGDHGEAFDENHLMQHGVGLYQHQVHVPLLIKYPHQSRPEVVTAPVSQVDIMPTVLDTLGIPAPAYQQGRSLRDPAVLAGRVVYSEAFPVRLFHDVIPRLDRTGRSVRAGNLKLTVSTRGTRELFDLAADPAEQHNLAATQPAESGRLEAILGRFAGLIPAPDTRAVHDEEQLRLLKGLGYIR